MIVKFFSTLHSQLNSVPVVSGQILCTSDVNGFYYDANDVRYKVKPADDVLYSLVSSENVTPTGLVGTLDYTKDTGVLGDSLQLTATEYAELEFVFYDNGQGTQFSSKLRGLPYGSNGLYTYNWCNKCVAVLDTDSTQTVNNNNIYRESVYATVVVSADGTFNVTSKTRISETVQDGVVTITESDISSDNRVALLQVIGRR